MKDYFKIHFQLFGEDGGTPPPATGEDGGEPANGKEKTTYTAEEVVALIQREADRRVSQALKKHSKNTEEKIKEAQRLAALSEEERDKEEIRTLRSELERRDKEISIRENTIALQTEMSKRGIPAEFTNFLVSDDADAMFDNLQTFDKVLKNLVNAEVEKRITSTTPKTGNVTDINTLTKEKFSKMSLSEQQKIYQNDKELYRKLTQ